MRHLYRLNAYFFRYKWHLAGGFVFIVISNLFALYPAQITRETVDFLETAIRLNKTGDNSSELTSSYAGRFFQLFLIILGSTLLKGLFMFFMRQTIIVMSRHIEFDIKNDIYRHYQILDAAFYKRNRTGDLMSRISEDVSQVRMYIGPAIMYALNLVVLFVMVVTAMVRVSPQLTLWVGIPLPMLSIGIYLVSHYTNRQSLKVQQQVGAVSSFSQTVFSGIRVIRSFVREPQIFRYFKTESLRYRHLSLSLIRMEAFFSPLITFLIGLSTIAAIVAGGYLYNRNMVTLGNIAEFVIYVNMLTWPVTSIGWVTAIVQKAAASQQRINEFLETEPAIKEGRLKPDFNCSELVVFDKVTFTYPETGITALKNISFVLRKGEALGITGKTGSGKSTVAQLLNRVYDPQEGSIYIGGKPLKEIDLAELRAQTGYVPQDVFLFSDTIYNNIIFGMDPGLPGLPGRVKTACHQAGMLSSIEKFPDGFNTLVGERGITLSGGQKQRISLARALVKQPSLLILDDCLSAVDTKTEYEILERIRPAVEETTAVLISHRISTIKDAAKILVLQEGEIREQGTNRELLLNGGLYAELANTQQEFA